MNRFMKVLKNGRIGRVCKISAIAIALIGVAQVALQLYLAWTGYQSLQAQAAQPGVINIPSFTYGSYLFPNLNSTLQIAATTIFYVVILYVAGVVLNAFFGPTKDEAAENDEDDTITYESLDQDNEVIIESIDKH